MLLVPRQLERAGMTGNVPYYGGRLTPAQAYAASHAAAPPPPPAAPAPPRASSVADQLIALESLHDDGVLGQEEYDRLRARVLA
jgi:hypothetical protein